MNTATPHIEEKLKCGGQDLKKRFKIHTLKKKLSSTPKNSTNISNPSITADGIAGKSGQWKVIQRLIYKDKIVILYSSSKFKVQIFNEDSETWRNFNEISRAQQFIQQIDSKLFYGGELYTKKQFRLHGRFVKKIKCLNCKIKFRRTRYTPTKFCSKKCRDRYWENKESVPHDS